MSRSMDPDWIPSTDGADALALALRRLDYTEEAILDLLGDDAFAADVEELPVYERRLGRSPLAIAARILFFALPTDLVDAERALGKQGVRALGSTGVASIGNEVVPHGRIRPAGDVLIASDGFSRGIDDPDGWVATYTPTARFCESLTPRRRVRRAVDVGTGSGIHALLAARHSDHVIATDVNPRALALTELNAALNGLDNLETRRGSLWDPVAGEEFDLVVCNAPFVISPETRWQYRDSALPGDEVSRIVVRGAAERLADDGMATMLVSWLAQGDDRDARPEEWLDGTGCDAWVLVFQESDALEHAAEWNSHVTHPDELRRTLDEWERYVAELGADTVVEGAVVLRKRDGRNRIRFDEVDPYELEDASAQVERALAGLAGESTFEFAESVRFEEERDASGRLLATRVRLDEGTFPVLELDDELAQALRRGAGPELRRRKVVRDLLELGFFES